MIYNGKVDIIIPAYNVPDKILFRCLSSIVCQDKLENIEVTIIDDASTKENYQYIIDKFDSILKINLLRLKENGGPGVARQHGLDHTKNEFITFIDADDVFSNYFAINSLREILIENAELQMIRGETHEVVKKQEECVVGPMGLNMIWLFGKVYRRNFLEKYNIRFHPTSRANEDVGFNAQWEMCLEDINKIGNFFDNVYFWLYNENSITREDNYSYNYRNTKDGSFYGFIENITYAVEECIKKKGKTNYIKRYIVELMVSVFIYYMECRGMSPENAPGNLEHCKIFYNKIYKPLEQEGIPQDLLTEVYTLAFRDFYHGEQFKKMSFDLDYFTFLKMLGE